MFAFRGHGGRTYRSHATRFKAVPRKEITRLLDLVAALPRHQATIARPEGDALEPDYRQTRVSWLHPGGDSDFLFARIEEVAAEVNDGEFGFDLVGCAEPIQYAEYRAPSVGYDWHVDLVDAPRTLQRKLSITIQLDAAGSYDGGDLTFRDGNREVGAERGQGAAIVFPSWALHRVTPITRGCRRSLVAWVGGPPFR
jgi:PKHD-type hydroxylase